MLGAAVCKTAHVPESEMMQCPYCAEDIRAAAIKCRYCHSDLTAPSIGSGQPSAPAETLWDESYPYVALTRAAHDKVAQLVETEGNPALSLRLTDGSNELPPLFFTEEFIPGDRVLKIGRTSLVIDMFSIASINNKVLDFDESKSESGFTLGDWRPAGLGANYVAPAETHSQGSAGSTTATTVTPVAHTPVPTGKEVPLLEWKGRQVMTRNATVPCRCLSCGARWTIEGALANTIANELGLAGRLLRGSSRLEQFGGTFTLGGSSRRIAAGNEAERQQADLVALFSLAACVQCGSTSVVLAKI